MSNEVHIEPEIPEDMGASQGDVAPQQVAEFDPNSVIYDQVAQARASIERTTERRRDPERRKRMERIQNAMEEVVTSRQELDAMQRDDQLDILEQVTMQLFDEDPEAQKNTVVIKQARENGKEASVASEIADQKQRYESLKRDVAFDLGIELEDVDAQNEQYRSHMIELVRNSGAKDEEEIMKSLGFLIYDEEKQTYKFNFPENLFPPHIVSKWRKYERLIGEHQRASALHDRALNNDPGEVTQLDLLRRLSHNSLAKEVQSFLHLEDWDFKRCRSFVKKMVEERFPNIDTKESVLTSESVINHLRILEALGGAIRQHGDDEDDDDD